MNERMVYLTNLLRHSTDVEFKIPSIYFTNNNAYAGIEKNRKEIQDALMTLTKDDELIISQNKRNEDVFVKISIKQPNGD